MLWGRGLRWIIEHLWLCATPEDVKPSWTAAWRTLGIPATPIRLCVREMCCHRQQRRPVALRLDALGEESTEARESDNASVESAQRFAPSGESFGSNAHGFVPSDEGFAAADEGFAPSEWSVGASEGLFAVSEGSVEAGVFDPGGVAGAFGVNGSAWAGQRRSGGLPRADQVRGLSPIGANLDHFNK